MKFRNPSSAIGWFLVLLILSAGCDDEESRRKLETLNQLAADTPLYPGFEQLRSSDYQKVGHATVIRCYSGRAHYDDVKSFYSQALEAKGWQHAEDQPLGGFHAEGSARLTFRKGTYAVVLQYENVDDPSGRLCNYSLAYYWNPP